jgi:two-component system sensor histidine kinase ChvG
VSLRRQLLAVSLLLLSLPWAGCQYLREVENTLRAGQGMAVVATAEAIAAALAERETLLYPAANRRYDTGTRDWYVAHAARPLIADGYADDWNEQAALQPLGDTPAGVTVRAATRGTRLYLLLQIQDSTPLYATPTRDARLNGDRVLLRCVDEVGATRRLLVATAAPGLVRAVELSGIRSGSAARVRGAWREQAGGYTVELQLPLGPHCQRLSLAIIDAREAAEQQRFDSRDLFDGETPWLVYRVPALDDWLGAFAATGRRIEVLDRGGWMVAEAAPVAAAGTGEAEVFWLLRALLRAVLRGQDAAPSSTAGATPPWHLRRPTEGPGLLVEARAALPAGGGVRVAETTERYLALTDRASTRVFAVSTGVLALALAGLFAYASVLSWRIRRLRDAALAIQREERDAGSFPRSRRRDEIGELSRGYADLLAQISEYNRYLRGLARTLSHELRTPIAVVSSSLEHLDEADLDAALRATYVERARAGLARLGQIVSAMSEASRIEESLATTAPERVRLDELVPALGAAYADAYPAQTIRCRDCDTALAVLGAPELIAQALDKLVDNAAGFAAAGTDILVALERRGELAAVSVENCGPLLPQSVGSRLFEPLVSVRERGEGRHLGLGLSVARSIAEHHGGSLQAANLADGSGVRFTLLLPLAPRA